MILLTTTTAMPTGYRHKRIDPFRESKPVERMDSAVTENPTYASSCKVGSVKRRLHLVGRRSAMYVR